MSASPQDAFETTYIAPTQREASEDAATQWMVGIALVVAALLSWFALA